MGCCHVCNAAAGASPGLLQILQDIRQLVYIFSQLTKCTDDRRNCRMHKALRAQKCSQQLATCAIFTVTATTDYQGRCNPRTLLPALCAHLQLFGISNGQTCGGWHGVVTQVRQLHLVPSCWSNGYGSFLGAVPDFACWHHAAPAMTLGSCCRMRSPSAVRTPGCPLHTSLARCGYSRLQDQDSIQTVSTQYVNPFTECRRCKFHAVMILTDMVR